MISKKTRIFIVDDSALVRKTLTELINHEEDLQVCGQVKNGREALRDIPIAKPDIAIVDLSLGDMNGMDLVKQLRRKSKTPPAVLVVSMHEEGVFLKEALAAGAKGYLMKGRAAEKVVEALRALARGETYP